MTDLNKDGLCEGYLSDITCTRPTWILRIPGTNNLIMRKDARFSPDCPAWPVIFNTEEEALRFARANNVNPRYVPTFIAPSAVQ
jgi:hypothetical protein